MKKKLFLVVAFVLVMNICFSQGSNELQRNKWSIEKVNNWYKNQKYKPLNI